MSLVEVLRPELERTGLPWRIENGRRHKKIILAGQLVGIIPMSGKGSLARGCRAVLNIRSQIRRAARG